MSEQINIIEDFLQEEEVFVSGIDGRVSHMDSYMTVIDFGALRTAIKKSTFSRTEWEAATKHWQQNSHLTPCIKLLALTMKRYLDGNLHFPQKEPI